jgi:hypothetical protein
MFLRSVSTFLSGDTVRDPRRPQSQAIYMHFKVYFLSILIEFEQNSLTTKSDKLVFNVRSLNFKEKTQNNINV